MLNVWLDRSRSVARPLSGAMMILALQAAAHPAAAALPAARAAATDPLYATGADVAPRGFDVRRSAVPGGWGQPVGDDSDIWGRHSFMIAENTTSGRSGEGEAGGRAADPGQPPAAALLADLGGVLTPRGFLVVEPQVEYSYDTSNRFFFNGIEIVDALLIGIIEVDKAQRETLTASLGMRYGLTSRLEADVRFPFVVRHDRLTRQEVGAAGESTDSLKMHGLGDIDFGLHYQLNSGKNNWPFFVANLRAQSDTGNGPYDIDPLSESPTGSGFWGVEPSLTVIYPSDPAVLFANVGYVHNFARSIDKDFQTDTGTVRIGNVDPGDSIRASFGVGFALNEELSLSLGYEHNWIGGTEQEQRDLATGVQTTNSSDDFQVGSLLFGLSLGVSDTIGLNINVAVGVTDEAPDARISVRLPMAFDLFS